MRYTIPASILLTLLLSACSGTQGALDKNSGYQTTASQASLELPPDLINTSTTKITSQLGKKAASVLPDLDDIVLRSNGVDRYLEINATAENVWAKVVDYTIKAGLPILAQNKRDGTIETDWIGDNSSDTKTRRALRERLGELIGRPPVNDKYSFWLEKLSDSKTALHISHRQLTESVLEQKRQDDVIVSNWVESEGDGFKAIQLLRKVAAFIGGIDIQSDNTSNVTLIQTEPAHIVLALPANEARDLVKRIIPGTRFIFENDDKKRNLLIIKKQKKKGFLSKLAATSRFGIDLASTNDPEKTRINIVSRRGKPVDHNDSLQVLYELAAGLRKALL